MGLLALLHLHIFQATLGLCPGTAGGQGDPHLYSAHGGHADFRGRDKAFFNFCLTRKSARTSRRRTASSACMTPPWMAAG